LQEVLTKAQITKLDELKKQRHEKWQKKHETLTDQKAPEPTK
jgi:periplasmic protein CpxP/Spy